VFLEQRKERNTEMKESFETIYEVVRIRQEIKELSPEEKFIIRMPSDAAKVAAEFIGDEDREVFFVMCVNVKNQVIDVHRAHVGGLNSSLVVPMETFKSAILNNSMSPNIFQKVYKILFFIRIIMKK
jgi:DNA repair protein RadC